MSHSFAHIHHVLTKQLYRWSEVKSRISNRKHASLSWRRKEKNQGVTLILSEHSDLSTYSRLWWCYLFILSEFDGCLKKGGRERESYVAKVLGQDVSSNHNGTLSLYWAKKDFTIKQCRWEPSLPCEGSRHTLRASWKLFLHFCSPTGTVYLCTQLNKAHC